MNNKIVEKIVEALIFTSEEPLTLSQIANFICSSHKSVTTDKIQIALENITHHYENRGIQLLKSQLGYQFVTLAEINDYINSFYEKKPMKISKSALEIMSIIAYLQPITRGRIENIRGVSNSNAIKFLKNNEWIKKIGRKEDAPGKPILIGTTKKFLRDFNLKAIKDLPKIENLNQINSSL